MESESEDSQENDLENEDPVGCYRAYPGSEFVVANTLSKWKKLEPNEINFSQGFS